jgi:hypothetical protein
MSLSDALRARIHQQAENRCGYCLMPAEFIYAPMQIDHIRPRAAGGTDDEANLWLSCPRCNGFKAAQVDGLDMRTGQRVALFNPRFQVWAEHFELARDQATIVGRTPCGRATVQALNLNFGPQVELRRWLVRYGVYPPAILKK